MIKLSRTVSFHHYCAATSIARQAYGFNRLQKNHRFIGNHFYYKNNENNRDVKGNLVNFRSSSQVCLYLHGSSTPEDPNLQKQLCENDRSRNI